MKKVGFQTAIKFKIEKYYLNLTTNEKYIAKIIAKSPLLLKDKTLDQLARTINVSPTSIYRFIKKIGFKNTFDLRHWIMEKNLEEVKTLPLVFDIQKTLVSLNVEESRKIFSLLMQASKIFILAGGSSKAIALLLEAKLIKLNLAAKYVAWDDYYLYHQEPNPVWMFVSLSGTSFDKEELEMLKLSKVRSSIIFSAILPTLTNLKNFSYVFYSKTKRDFTTQETSMTLDLEILCLVVINWFIKSIRTFLTE